MEVLQQRRTLKHRKDHRPLERDDTVGGLQFAWAEEVTQYTFYTDKRVQCAKVRFPKNSSNKPSNRIRSRHQGPGHVPPFQKGQCWMSDDERVHGPFAVLCLMSIRWVTSVSRTIPVRIEQWTYAGTKTAKVKSYKSCYISIIRIFLWWLANTVQTCVYQLSSVMQWYGCRVALWQASQALCKGSFRNVHHYEAFMWSYYVKANARCYFTNQSKIKCNVWKLYTWYNKIRLIRMIILFAKNITKFDKKWSGINDKMPRNETFTNAILLNWYG